MAAAIEIVTPRFILRSLAADDVSDRYLGWFRDPDAERFIDAAKTTSALSDLERYVRERVGRDDVVFLGIFEKETQLHIGNIKYEPVNSEEGFAVMGILVGDASYRGKGVTSEVLAATTRWLKENRRIRTIRLGVAKGNYQAIRAYEKAGFEVVHAAEAGSKDAWTMVLHL